MGQAQITGTALSTGAPEALAWGDGEHDDQPILQAAWDACGLIAVPAGNCRIDPGTAGFAVEALLAGGDSLGQWKGLSTFANGGYGIAFLGDTKMKYMLVRACWAPVRQKDYPGERLGQVANADPTGSVRFWWSTALLGICSTAAIC